MQMALSPERQILNQTEQFAQQERHHSPVMIVIVGRQKAGDQQPKEYGDLIGHGRGLARPDQIGKGWRWLP